MLGISSLSPIYVLNPIRKGSVPFFRMFEPSGDVDLALYEGFLDNADTSTLMRIRRASLEELAQLQFDFNDRRLPDLLFRYRARNWPETLSNAEKQRWEQFRLQRLIGSNSSGNITLADFSTQIALLRKTSGSDANTGQILDALEAWGKKLFRESAGFQGNVEWSGEQDAAW